MCFRVYAVRTSCRLIWLTPSHLTLGFSSVVLTRETLSLATIPNAFRFYFYLPFVSPFAGVGQGGHSLTLRPKHALRP